MGRLRRYAIGILLGLDQLGNTLIGGAPDETISSRAGRARRGGRWWGQALCWALDKLDPGHCDDAVEAEARGGHREEVLDLESPR